MEYYLPTSAKLLYGFLIPGLLTFFGILYLLDNWKSPAHKKHKVWLYYFIGAALYTLVAVPSVYLDKIVITEHEVKKLLRLMVFTRSQTSSYF